MHCELLRRQILNLYAGDREDIDKFEADAIRVVCTVASCQGLEDHFIIYTPGRGPMQNRPVGRESLIEIIRELCVLTTRAQCYFIYAAYMG